MRAKLIIPRNISKWFIFLFYSEFASNKFNLISSTTNVVSVTRASGSKINQDAIRTIWTLNTRFWMLKVCWNRYSVFFFVDVRLITDRQVTLNNTRQSNQWHDAVETAELCPQAVETIPQAAQIVSADNTNSVLGQSRMCCRVSAILLLGKRDWHVPPGNGSCPPKRLRQYSNRLGWKLNMMRVI